MTSLTASTAEDLPTRVSLADTVSQTLTLAWRATMKMRRNFEQMFDVTIQPLLFTAMFAGIFGGAISGSVAGYHPVIIPGLVGQTVMTACVATGVQLREDMDKGVFDRFKVLPIARIAPLAGPAPADRRATGDGSASSGTSVPPHDRARPLLGGVRPRLRLRGPAGGPGAALPLGGRDPRRHRGAGREGHHEDHAHDARGHLGFPAMKDGSPHLPAVPDV